MDKDLNNIVLLAKHQISFNDVQVLKEHSLRTKGIKPEDDVAIQLEKKEAEFEALELESLVLKVKKDQQQFSVFKCAVNLWDTQCSTAEIEFAEATFDQGTQAVSDAFDKRIPALRVEKSAKEQGTDSANILLCINRANTDAVLHLRLSTHNNWFCVIANHSYASVLDKEFLVRSGQTFSTVINKAPEKTCGLLVLGLAGAYGSQEDPSSIRQMQLDTEKEFNKPALGLTARIGTINFNSVSNWSKCRSGSHWFLFIHSNQVHPATGNNLCEWLGGRLSSWLQIGPIDMFPRSEMTKVGTMLGQMRLSPAQEKQQWCTGKDLWHACIVAICEDLVFGPNAVLTVIDVFPYDGTLPMAVVDLVSTPDTNVPPLVCLSIAMSEDFAPGKDAQVKAGVQSKSMNYAYGQFKDGKLTIPGVAIKDKPTMTTARPTYRVEDYAVCRVVSDQLILPNELITKLSQGKRMEFVMEHNKEFNKQGLKVSNNAGVKRGAPEPPQEPEKHVEPPAKILKIEDAEKFSTVADLDGNFENVQTISTNGINLHVLKPASPGQEEGIWISSDTSRILQADMALGSVGPGVWVDGQKAKDVSETTGGRWYQFKLASEEDLVIGSIEPPPAPTELQVPTTPITLRKFLNLLAKMGHPRAKIISHTIVRRDCVVNGELSYKVTPLDSGLVLRIEDLKKFKPPQFNNCWGFATCQQVIQREHLQAVPLLKCRCFCSFCDNCVTVLCPNHTKKN